jgi:hypothetical protein
MVPPRAGTNTMKVDELKKLIITGDTPLASRSDTRNDAATQITHTSKMKTYPNVRPLHASLRLENSRTDATTPLRVVVVARVGRPTHVVVVIAPSVRAVDPSGGFTRFAAMRTI